jgi:hypothetical protein
MAAVGIDRAVGSDPHRAGLTPIAQTPIGIAHSEGQR